MGLIDILIISASLRKYYSLGYEIGGWGWDLERNKPVRNSGEMLLNGLGKTVP